MPVHTHSTIFLFGGSFPCSDRFRNTNNTTLQGPRCFCPSAQALNESTSISLCICLFNELNICKLTACPQSVAANHLGASHVPFASHYLETLQGQSQGRRLDFSTILLFPFVHLASSIVMNTLKQPREYSSFAARMKLNSHFVEICIAACLLHYHKHRYQHILH